MAKTKENNALETRPTAEMERPSFIPQDDVRGTEHIGREDVAMPRLAIAQALSPQIEEGNAKYIEGLKNGDLFNSLTGDTYGKGPITFIVVRADVPRGIEFNPRDEGGGIKDPNVPLNDPRMEFGPDGEQPIATKFYDFIVMIADGSFKGEIAALSFSRTGIATAKALNGLMKLRRGPVFGALYTGTSVLVNSAKGFKYYSLRVQNAGWIQEEALYRRAETAFEALKEKPVVIDRGTADDHVDDSMASNPEAPNM